MKNYYQKGLRSFRKVMIIITILAILAAITAQVFVRARKRLQAWRIVHQLQLVENAVDQYAIQTQRETGFKVPTSDWRKYIKAGVDRRLAETGKDALGNDFGDQKVSYLPRVPNATKEKLSGVTDNTFWLPYH